jgi:hypothetical protein
VTALDTVGNAFNVPRVGVVPAPPASLNDFKLIAVGREMFLSKYLGGIDSQLPGIVNA